MSAPSIAEYPNHANLSPGAASTSTPTHSHLSPATTATNSAPTSAGSMSSNGGYASPSAYINDQYHASQPNTPHGPLGLQHTLSYGVDENSYPYGYPSDYSDPHGFGAPPPVDQSTPSAPTRLEDDRTPVVSDQHHPIHPSSMPSHPGAKPLMSPFKPYQQQPGMMFPPGDGSPTYYDHANAMYAHVPGMPYYDGSPVDPNTFAQIPMPPQFIDQSAPPAPMPEQQVYQPPPTAQSQNNQAYDFGPPTRSSNGSPNSTVSSSAASLTRSASTSSELRVRPKVKLTFEDKRNIVELHRKNSSLRQEDIAREYGVDRSTISKIILSAHRWTQPSQNDPISQPRSLKAVGGRFPAIEAAMHQWMDQEIAAGRDVRDNIARDQAKAIAREIGFPMDRFKASAKWLDKFKDRRRAAGKPTTSAMHMGYGYYPYPSMPYPGMPMGESVMLSRSQSTLTLSSSDSSGADQFQPSPGFIPSPGYMQVPAPINPTRSESDLTNVESTPASRQRSQSSPQLITEPGNLTPSSGKAVRAVRPSPLSLHRQNSYHGTSPSPRRPAPLSRANSSQGTFGLKRPSSLAASAFGITPLGGDEAYSPLPSPSISASSGGTHSRQRSDTSLAPFTHSMGVMSISPDMSEGGDVHSIPMAMGIPPMTPITPGHPGAHAVFPNSEYADLNADMPMGGPPPPMHHPHHMPPHAHPGYATMPNKHYVSPGYMPYPPTAHSDFGPAYPGPPEMNAPMQWH